ncbi:MAG: hypothetical protein IT380_14125 [Myxococcales bacterium]|nr:hypothetical protein [Myxococcales bacterium]
MAQQKNPGGKEQQKRAPTGQIPAQGGAAPAKTATGQIPVQGGAGHGHGAAPSAPGAIPGAPADGTFDPLAPQKPPPSMTTHQKQALGSAFMDTNKVRQQRALLGTNPGARENDEEEVSVVTRKFDGEQAPEELQRRDVWKAVQAPVQSREGKRSLALLDQVIRQFAVGSNPRYAEDAPGRPRAHIFVWDVSRAMGCEIPHFVGAKELTLAQTCDWLRHEGPMRGWKRVGEFEVLEVVEQGQLVVAVPKDIKVKLIAVVAPQEAAADGKPRLTGACLKRGGGLTNLDAFGVRPLDFFTHA